MLLGELLGNPKGTKSFSSWSEFTDFVNEMPIKTIQPFVSNFNAFAGEGFYGNVVQGLVIKQLEDAVFIFGIAIDGTLIFRKRNYPDVSTWEDPKIIIHSNNWHKIYFVTDLGELIGTATGNKSGLMSVEDKKRLGRRFFKGYTKLVESKYWYNHYVALIFGASPASNLGSLIAIDWKGDEPISVTRFLGNNDNVKLYLGRNPETNMHELWLGLIGLDGDGSEFIIQSRESIDLDSKTVETLPSYLKVISISWQKNNDFSELGELLPLSTNTNKGLTRRTAYFDLIQGKLYKIAYKEELHVYKPVICLLYVLRSGISSCYVASLSGYRNGVSHFKLICGNDIQFKLYQKLNSANYFDFMLECPDNSAGIMEIKAMIDLTVIETTEPLRDWQQIATE